MSRHRSKIRIAYVLDRATVATAQTAPAIASTKPAGWAREYINL